MVSLYIGKQTHTYFPHKPNPFRSIQKLIPFDSKTSFVKWDKDEKVFGVFVGFPHKNSFFLPGTTTAESVQ